VYQIPARNEMSQFGYALQFNQVSAKFEVHDCGLLPGIWDYRLRSLDAERRILKLPKAQRLVSIVSSKRILGPDRLHLIALKGVAGRKSCSFFVGDGTPKCGDLAVLCGRGDEQRLLINAESTTKSANHLLAWAAPGDSANLNLPRRWYSDN
jgi:hypothetical protein